MYGGFYDVALYNQSQEQTYFDAAGDEEAFLRSRPPLSSDLIQPYKPPNPWPSSLTFEGDFILVCEFSEIEGPVPLFTIPRDAAGDFDDNAFALKIMAIDYNATNSSRSSIPFMLIDDTGVLLEEVQEGAYAYVHHFTLYDLSARGFVRPFCMAYITPDKKKLTTHFEWLLGRFKKISQLFCYGNRLNFEKELHERLTDLTYTIEQHVLQHPEVKGRLHLEPPLGSIPHNLTKLPEGKLAALQKSVREIKNILSIIKPTLNNPRLDAQCRQYQQNMKQSLLWRRKGRRKSASVHEEGYHSDGDQQETPRDRNITFTSADDLTPVMTQDDTYVPKLISVDGHRRFDKRLRTMHELCGYGCVQGRTRLKRLHKYFSRDHLIMRMEQRESNMVSPTSALLTIGRTVTINFMQDIDWDRLLNYQAELSGHQNKLGAYRHNSFSFSSAFSLSSGVEDDTSSLPSYEAKFVAGSTYASLESLYYDVEESLESPHSSDDGEIEISTTTVATDKTLLSSSTNSWDEIHHMEFKENHYSNTSLDESVRRSLSSSPVSNKGSDSTSTNDSSRGMQDSTRMGGSSSFSSFESAEYGHRVTGNGEPTLRRHFKVPVGSFISRLSSHNTELPGCGIKNFVGHCVFAVHIIYALLSGRTVVIAASPKYEREVNSLIKTLWIFVPGHSSRHHLVVPWHTKSLTILDLSRMKLVGLAVTKSLHQVIPRSVQRYVSTYDYEHSTLWTPRYKGTYINSIVSGHKHFLSDQAYIAYIQGILLDMATKAYLYYHSFCLNSPPSNQNGEGLKASDRQYRNASSACLNKLGLMEGDTKIIQYWVDIIKQQQIDELCTPGPPASTIKLDLRQCTRFQM